MWPMAATNCSDARSNALGVDSSHHRRSRIVRAYIDAGGLFRHSENGYDGGYTGRERGAHEVLWPQFAYARLEPETLSAETRVRPKVQRVFGSWPIEP